GLLLDDLEELDLQRQLDVTDLVEEQGAAVGGLEQARLGRLGVRVGAALVAEELGLEKRGRNGGAVDLDEWPAAPRALVVDGAGGHFLAPSRLPADQDRRRGAAIGALQRGHPLDLLLQELDRRGFPDDVGDAAAPAVPRLEIGELLPHALVRARLVDDE